MSGWVEAGAWEDGWLGWWFCILRTSMILASFSFVHLQQSDIQIATSCPSPQLRSILVNRPSNLTTLFGTTRRWRKVRVWSSILIRKDHSGPRREAIFNGHDLRMREEDRTRCCPRNLRFQKMAHRELKMGCGGCAPPSSRLETRKFELKYYVIKLLLINWLIKFFFFERLRGVGDWQGQPFSVPTRDQIPERCGFLNLYFQRPCVW